MSDMTGAELKVQLTGLGLTPAWLAGQLGVASRTVIRWFDQDKVPAKAAREVERITTVTDAEITRLIETAEHGPLGDIIRTQRTDADISGVQHLNTLPASWHRALTYRAMRILRTDGINVTVEYGRFSVAVSGESGR